MTGTTRDRSSVLLLGTSDEGGPDRLGEGEIAPQVSQRVVPGTDKITVGIRGLYVEVRVVTIPPLLSRPPSLLP